MNNKVTKSAPKPRRLRRGIYLLPNIFTLGAMFAGFFSIISSAGQHFGPASWAILIAMVLDSLDGRVARLTQTQSEFGAELDSLSDLVSFGLAPAMLSYYWLLHGLDKAGWLSCFIFMACTALRLARFNSQAENSDCRYFRGLSSPMAAGLLATLVLVCEGLGWRVVNMSYILFVIVIFAGLLMVSTLRYRSFKDVNLGGKVPFAVMLFIVMILVLISYSPDRTLFILFASYVLSGPVMFCWRLYLYSSMRKKRLKRRRARSQKGDKD